MKAIGYKTPKITESCDIVKVITSAIENVPDDSVIVVSSKIIAIAEGSVVSKSVNKEALISEQAEYMIDPAQNKYHHHFTIKHHTLVGAAGIDDSNGGENHVLLPRDPQKSANYLRMKLSDEFNMPVGVVVTDSVSLPLQRGASGIVLAHSGFEALKNYIGKPDLFGEAFKISMANRAQGIAATANLVMGEGTEQTPIVVVSDIPNFLLNNRDPTEVELKELYPDIEDDLFETFWRAVGWIK